jgi:invasion protein IalB
MRLFRLAANARIGGYALLCLFALESGSIAQTLQPKAKQPTPAGAVAPAQPAPGEVAPQKPTWMVNCTNVPGGFDCRASQTLLAQNSGQRILTLVIRTTPNSKKPIMMIQGPLGIYLPAGLTLQIGKDAGKVLPLESCDQAGCLTEYAVTEAEIEAMRGGADLTITVRDLKKKPVTLKVPGLGFADAYAKMQ